MTLREKSEASSHETRVTAAEGRTVESELRAKLTAGLGGLRGSLEIVLPFVAFSVAYGLTASVTVAVSAGVATTLALLGGRLLQRSSTRFVRAGTIAIVIGGVAATTTGRAETAFLPGIITSASVATVAFASVLVRWPLAGFLVGGVLGHRTAWRRDPALLRLSSVLTVVLLTPSLLRALVQYPLYVAGEAAWLGAAKAMMGWPLTAATLATVTAILLRGRTPLPDVLAADEATVSPSQPVPRLGGG